MSATEPREMVRAICPDLELSGCYEHIMPRVTGEQLTKLLDVAEQGENAPVWSGLVVEFFQHGQQELVAANIDRLVPLVTVNNDAYWVLANAPHLTTDHCVTLVSVFKDSWDVAGVLVDPDLTDEHRNRLIPLVKNSEAATWVLRNAPNLSEENREHLAKVAG